MSPIDRIPVGAKRFVNLSHLIPNVNCIAGLRKLTLLQGLELYYMNKESRYKIGLKEHCRTKRIRGHWKSCKLKARQNPLWQAHPFHRLPGHYYRIKNSNNTLTMYLPSKCIFSVFLVQRECGYRSINTKQLSWNCKFMIFWDLATHAAEVQLK